MIPSMAAGVKDRPTVYARVFLCDQGCEGQMGLANKLEQGGSCEKGFGRVQFFLLSLLVRDPFLFCSRNSLLLYAFFLLYLLDSSF